MNQPTPNPSQEGSRTADATAVPLLGGVRGGFMVRMHDSGIVEAFHESRIASFLVELGGEPE